HCAPPHPWPGCGGHGVRPRLTLGCQSSGSCGAARLRGPGRDPLPQRLGGPHLRRTIRRRALSRRGRCRDRRRHDGWVASQGGPRAMKLCRYELTLEPRPALPPFHAVLTAVVAILLALAFSSVLFLSAETNIFTAYRAVFSYAFFNSHGLLATVHRSIFLLFCTYAFLVPLRAGLWNIGLPVPLHAPLLLGVPFTALLALGAAVLLDPLFAKTALGYRIRAFGESPAAARYGGIIPMALSLVVFLLGGAFAGLAGYHYFAA